MNMYVDKIKFITDFFVISSDGHNLTGVYALFGILVYYIR